MLAVSIHFMQLHDVRAEKRPATDAHVRYRATSAMAGSDRVVLASVTCTGDGLDHRVRDAELGGAGWPGRYQAVCGRLVLPAPLVAAPGPVCPECSASLAEVDQQPRSQGGLARMLRRLGGIR